MKPYTIQYARPARKELEALPSKIQERIVEAVDALGENPRPQRSKKLKDTDNTYRIRVGDYRAIYEICDKTVVVYIIRIRHRKDAYQ